MNLAQTFNPWIAGIVVALTALISACASVPPELAQARDAYADAQSGPASQYAPAELQEAQEALIAAEAAFDDEGNDEITRSLAYRALRKAQTAMVRADIYTAQRQVEQRRQQLFAEGEQARQSLSRQLSQTESELAERQQLQAMTLAELQEERQRLDEMKVALQAAVVAGELTEQELQARQQQLAVAETELEQERKEREQAEARLQEVRAQLEKVAQIQEDARQLVITLNGSVLFELDESELLPTAQRRLDQVAEMLLAQRNASIVVEGHTDSQGTEPYNRELSQERAESVTTYLMSKGIARDRLEAVGRGESEPIATNDSPAGRANNRRVEIIVDKQSMTDESAALEVQAQPMPSAN